MSAVLLEPRANQLSGIRLSHTCELLKIVLCRSFTVMSGFRDLLISDLHSSAHNSRTSLFFEASIPATPVASHKLCMYLIACSLGLPAPARCMCTCRQTVHLLCCILTRSRCVTDASAHAGKVPAAQLGLRPCSPQRNCRGAAVAAR